jgi:hypothetical protein
LIKKKNEDTIPALIEDYERKSYLSSILCKFRILRKYRAKQPITDYPEETKNYKTLAIEMGKELIENFYNVVWPNHIHNIIEHVQELIERPNGPGTVVGSLEKRMEVEINCLDIF